MSRREYYIGSVGPLFYDDTDEYVDGTGISHTAFRGEQMYIENSPTLPQHVARSMDLDSIESAAFSKTDSANLSQSAVISNTDSRLDSSLSKASQATSNLDSAISSMSTVVSSADSKSDSTDISQSVVVSVLESRVASHGL